MNNNYVPKPYYVVQNEDHVVTRYLFIYNSLSLAHRTNSDVKAADLQLPQTEYSVLLR